MNALILIHLLGFIIAGVTAQTCGTNEAVLFGTERCYNYCDELTSTTICRQRTTPLRGCYCEVGFCRSGTGGQCVAVPTCGQNAALGNGDDRCYSFCNNLLNTTICQKQDQPTQGCYCNVGSCRQGAGGLCVNIPICSGQNEELGYGNDRCYNYCANVNNTNICQICYSPVLGCYCEEGYCRTGVGGQCILQLAAVPCSNTTDLVVLLDSSGSIGSANYDTAKSFVSDFVSAFIAQGISTTRVAFIIFSDTVTTVIQLTNTDTPAEISSEILAAPYLASHTNTGPGIDAAIAQFNSSPRTVPLTLVVVTDGLSTFAVGVGPGTDQTELETIANAIACFQNG